MFRKWTVELKLNSVLAKLIPPEHSGLSEEELVELHLARKALAGAIVRAENRLNRNRTEELRTEESIDAQIAPEIGDDILQLVGEEGLKQELHAAKHAVSEAMREAKKIRARRGFLVGFGGILLAGAAAFSVEEGCYSGRHLNRLKNDKDKNQQGTEESPKRR